MKKAYITPNCNVLALQSTPFMNLSGGNGAEDPINSTKENSLSNEEETMEWKEWDTADSTTNVFYSER